MLEYAAAIIYQIVPKKKKTAKQKKKSTTTTTTLNVYRICMISLFFSIESNEYVYVYMWAFLSSFVITDEGWWWVKKESKTHSFHTVWLEIRFIYFFFFCRILFLDYHLIDINFEIALIVPLNSKITTITLGPEFADGPEYSRADECEWKKKNQIRQTKFIQIEQCQQQQQ